MPDNDSTSNDPLSGLLGALLGGNRAVQGQLQNSGQSLDQILGNLASGTSPTPSGSPTGSPLGDIMGTLTSGAPQGESTGAPGASGDPLAAMLGGLLGGMPPGGASSPQAQAGDPMGAMLGGLLGGGMQGGFSSGSGLESNSFLAPIIDAIAGKIGIPPQIAGAIVTFALTQLMSGQRDPRLAQMLGGEGTVSQKYLRESGMADQLAQQTGLDKKTAVKSLQQVLGVWHANEWRYAGGPPADIAELARLKLKSPDTIERAFIHRTGPADQTCTAGLGDERKRKLCRRSFGLASHFWSAFWLNGC